MSAISSLRHIKADGGVCVGSWHDGWKLYAFPKPEGSVWRKVRIRRPGAKRTGLIRSVNLTWNGQRFADSSVAASVSSALIEWAAGEMGNFEKEQGRA